MCCVVTGRRDRVWGGLRGSALPRDTFDDDGIGEDDGLDGHDV